MISSDMEEILNMSDRVAVMHEGAITGTLARAECTEERIMTLAVGEISSRHFKESVGYAGRGAGAGVTAGRAMPAAA